MCSDIKYTLSQSKFAKLGVFLNYTTNHNTAKGVDYMENGKKYLKIDHPALASLRAPLLIEGGAKKRYELKNS